jgi:tetratricopeptide (TPR) repeat protein
LKFYSKNKKKIVDKCEAYDLEGRLYTALDNEEKSVQAYEALLDLNPANIDTYYKVLNAKGIALTKDANQELSKDEQAKIKETLAEYEAKYPRVGAHMRIAIRHLQGEVFSETLRRYTRPMIIKGVPSMLQDLRELYTNSDKVERIYNVLNDCLTSMEKEMTLSPAKDEEE